MLQLTVKEFAKLCGVDRNIAGQALRLFEIHGVVRLLEGRKVRKRGKPAKYYEVPDRLELDLTRLAQPDVVGV